ncbi:MAG: bifunctional diaminohydroxyphosphoribosylaminopyrimidine deaminase/5-amino-6-(5-phosphoribosylamino)uracil reductase RibD [Actinomycetes bacterium]
MRRALDLAARGAATTRPNPVVGAVVLDASGQVVGEGWHARAGGPHAEVVALDEAGDRARGGTIVVTLEPCNHTGRTGPCTVAVRAAGLRRLVVAVADPTPEAGGGAQTLQAAGLDVETGVLADEAEVVNRRWLTAVRHGRPWVVWKFAATLDGRSAAPDGTSRWISSPQSRADTHALRAASDTIIAGVGTVLADDPALTVRDAAGRPVGEQPLRVLVDTHGRTPADAQARDAAAETWVATGAEVGVSADGQVDLEAMLRALYARGSRVALLEGGPRLAGSFLRAGLVDEVVAYLAPTLLGAGPSALAGTGVTTLADALALDIEDVRRVGPDVRIAGRPRRTTSSAERALPADRAAAGDVPSSSSPTSVEV